MFIVNADAFIIAALDLPDYSFRPLGFGGFSLIGMNYNLKPSLSSFLNLFHFPLNRYNLNSPERFIVRIAA
jgi:hypothetical protein